VSRLWDTSAACGRGPVTASRRDGVSGMSNSGDWDKTEELAQEGLRLCESEQIAIHQWRFRYPLALIVAARGEDEPVHSLTDQLTRWGRPRRMHLMGILVHHVRDIAALGQGDYEQAYQHASAISPSGMLASHIPHALWATMDLVEAAVRTGRRAEARARRRHKRRRHRSAVPPVRPPGKRGRGDRSTSARSPPPLPAGTGNPPLGSLGIRACTRPAQLRPAAPPRPGHRRSTATAHRRTDHLRTPPGQTVGHPRRQRTPRHRPDKAPAPGRPGQAAHTTRTDGCHTRRIRPDQQGNRRTALPVRPDSRRPPAPGIPETRHHHQGRTTRRASLHPAARPPAP
jgi:hypothetical protein